MFNTIAAGVSAGFAAVAIASAVDNSNKGWVYATGSVAAIAASVFTRSTFVATLGSAVLGGGVAGMCVSSFDREGISVEKLGRGFMKGAKIGLGCTAMIMTGYGVIRVLDQISDFLKTQQVVGWTFVNGQFVPIFGTKT